MGVLMLRIRRRIDLYEGRKERCGSTCTCRSSWKRPAKSKCRCRWDNCFVGLRAAAAADWLIAESWAVARRFAADLVANRLVRLAAAAAGPVHVADCAISPLASIWLADC